jgi:hypothetical protein
MQSWGQGALGIIGQLGIALGGLSIAKQAVAMSASAEDMTVSFGVLAGSAERGKQLVQDLQVLAAKTPFELPSLLSASKMLLTYGTNVEDILPTLQSLGDVTGGDADKLQRMSYAMAQVNSQGRLTGHVAREMAYAGFSPAQVLAEDMAKTLGGSVAENLAKVNERMHKGGLSVQDVQKAFTLATSEGGRFFGHMEKRSQTLTGLFSTMKDDIGAALRALGGEITDALDLKGVVRGVSASMQGLTEFFRGLPPEVQKAGAALLTFGGAVGGISLTWALLGPAVIGTWTTVTNLFLGSVAAVKGVVTGFQALAYALTTVNTAATAGPLTSMLLTAAPYAAAAAGIALVVAAVYQFGGGAAAVEELNQALERSAGLGRIGEQQFLKEATAVRERLASIADPVERRSALSEELSRARQEAEGTSRNLDGVNRQIQEQAGFWSGVARVLPGRGSLADLEAEAEQFNTRLRQSREHAQLLQDELKKMGAGGEAPAGVAKLTSALELQIQTLGMSKDQATLYKLRLEGATESQLANAVGLMRMAEQGALLVKQQKELNDGTQRLQESLTANIGAFGLSSERVQFLKLQTLGLGDADHMLIGAKLGLVEALGSYHKALEDGRQVTEGLRTPLEVYGDRLKELRRLAGLGVISQGTFARGVKEAKDQLRQAAAAAAQANQEVQKLDAVLAGSAEGISHVIEYQERVLGQGGSGGAADAGAMAAALAAPVPTPTLPDKAPLDPKAEAQGVEMIKLLGMAVSHLGSLVKKPGLEVKPAGLK